MVNLRDRDDYSLRMIISETIQGLLCSESSLVLIQPSNNLGTQGKRLYAWLWNVLYENN